jgi:hypothetical protein
MKWDEGSSDMIEWSPHINTLSISARLNVSHTQEMYPHYAYILRKKVVGWNVSTRLMLPHPQMIRFVYRRGPFYPQWSRQCQKNPVYGIMIIHTVKSNNIASP